MTNPYYQRGLLLQSQGRLPDAEREFRQALAQEPHNANAHSMLALCLTDQKRFPEATAEAQQAVGLAPDAPFGHYALARILYDRNRFDEAEIAINEAIRLDAADPDFFAMLAGIRIERRLWPGALQAAEEGLKFDPRHNWCTNLRAIALVRLGRRDDAHATIDTALHHNPENATTHANQGWALLHRGDHVKAMEHFREALRLKPELLWAKQGIVEALKARYFIYRWMLMYFLWMSRLSQLAQWGIILGAYIGYNVLRTIAKGHPEWSPYIWPILYAYLGFVILTWLSDPIFNLLLRLNRFGRYALSREQVISANWVGVLLLCVAASAVWWWFGWEAGMIATIVSALLMVPVSSVMRCAAGWPRTTMFIASIGLAIVGIGTILLCVGKDLSTGEARQHWDDAAGALILLFGAGTFLSVWGSNWLRSVRPRV